MIKPVGIPIYTAAYHYYQDDLSSLKLSILTGSPPLYMLDFLRNDESCTNPAHYD